MKRYIILVAVTVMVSLLYGGAIWGKSDNWIARPYDSRMRGVKQEWDKVKILDRRPRVERVQIYELECFDRAEVYLDLEVTDVNEPEDKCVLMMVNHADEEEIYAVLYPLKTTSTDPIVLCKDDAVSFEIVDGCGEPDLQDVMEKLQEVVRNTLEAKALVERGGFLGDESPSSPEVERRRLWLHALKDTAESMALPVLRCYFEGMNATISIPTEGIIFSDSGAFCLKVRSLLEPIPVKPGLWEKFKRYLID